MILSAAHFVHELGHFITAKVLRLKKLVLVMGKGRTIFAVQTINMRIEVNLLFFLGGYTTSDARAVPSYWKQSLIAVGGPMFNLLVVVFTLLLVRLIDANSTFFISFIVPIIAMNLWIGAVNLLPFKWNGKESDGWSFIKNSILAMRSA
jgi:hypothetical protein